MHAEKDTKPEREAATPAESHAREPRAAAPAIGPLTVPSDPLFGLAQAAASLPGPGAPAEAASHATPPAPNTNGPDDAYAALAARSYLQPSGAPASQAGLAARIRSAARGGQSLAPALRGHLEGSLGADLGQVRLHSDPEADALARTLDARAFTSGRDIFFRQGALAPETSAGLRLLAHEAAHTIQQARGPVEGLPGPGGVQVSQPGDRFERAAQAMAARAAGGPGRHLPAPGLPLPAAGAPHARLSIQREPNGATATDDRATRAAEVLAGSLDEAAINAINFVTDAARDTRLIIVIDGSSLRVYDGYAKPLTSTLSLREPATLRPGVYWPVLETTGYKWYDEPNRGLLLHRVYVHPSGKFTFDPQFEQLNPKKGSKITGDYSIVNQLNPRDLSIYTQAVRDHDAIFVVPGAVEGGSAQSAGADTGAASSSGEDISGQSQDPPKRSRPRRSKAEGQFSSGGKSPNLPAFPAQLLGPDMQPAGGLGSYRMQLNFNFYDNTVLGGALEAMHYVDYHWESIPIPDDVIERSRKAAEEELQRSLPGVTVSEGQAAEQLRGDARRGKLAGGSEVGLGQGRSYRHDEVSRERAEDLAVVEQHNILLWWQLKQEIEISSGWRQLMAYAADLGEVMGGDFSEREIPWPQKEGWYILRCVAQPEATGENLRAASVQTKLVEVRSQSRLAREELDRPGTELDKRKAEIKDLEKQRDKLDEKDPQRQKLDDRIKLLTSKLKRAELRAFGDIKEMLEAELADANEIERLLKLLAESSLSDKEIAATQAKLEEHGASTPNVRAINRSGPENPYILRHELRDVAERISRIKDQLELLGKRDAEMSGTIIRPQAVFTSRVTGQTFPLLLQLGQAAGAEGASFTYIVSDVTTPDGHTGKGRGATPGQAATAALADFAQQNEYGRGLLVVRLPDGAPFQLATNEFANRPGTEAIARARIGDVVAALIAIGLIASGVGAVAGIGALSAAGSALGTAAAALGAVQGADSLLRHWSEHTSNKVQVINDLVAVLGGLLPGVSAIGDKVRLVRAGKIFALMEAGADAQQVLEAEQAMRRAATFVDAMKQVEEKFGHIGFVWGNATALDEIIAINQAEERGDIDHTTAAGRRASLIAGAIPGAIQFAMGLGERAGAAEKRMAEADAPARRSGESAPSEPAPPGQGRAQVEDPRAGGARGDQPEASPAARTEPAAPRPPAEGQTPADRSGERTMAGTAGKGPPASAPEHIDAARAARLAAHESFVASARERLNQSRSTPRSTEPELQRGYTRRRLSVENAYSNYEEVVARAGDREVGLWFNLNTGEYAVTVGSPHAVSAPAGDGWQAALHLHRNPGNIKAYRNPAPADVYNTMLAAFRNGRPTTEFVESIGPGDVRRTTAVTVDPATRTITIEYTPPDGKPVHKTYASVEAYVEAYGEGKTGIDLDSPEGRWIIDDLDQYYAMRRRDAGQRTAAGSVPPDRAPGDPAAGAPHPAAAPGEAAGSLAHRETGPQTPGAQHALAELLYQLQQPGAQPRPAELTPTQSAARELIRSVSDWKGGLRRVTESIEHPQERASATQALVEARQMIVDNVYQRVLHNYPDVYMFNSGTVSFGSDIDITIRPIEQRADFSGKPRDRATQIKDAAEAAQFFAEQLRATVGGETDKVIDTNVYAYIGENSFIAEASTPEGRAAQARANRVAGFAAQIRGQGKRAWESFRSEMEARFAADSSPEGQDAANQLRAQMKEAEAYHQARANEHAAALERARASNPNATSAELERMAREDIVREKSIDLSLLAAQNPPDLARIADLQSQILWFQPDAYVTRSAIDQAVAHQQGQRAAGTSGAAASAGDATKQSRRAALEQDLTTARRALEELRAKTPPATEKDLSAAHAKVQDLERQFADEVRADLAAIGQAESARGLSVQQQLAHSAAAASENLGMLTEHVHAAGDNLSAQVKAACKYGGRILLAEHLAGLGTSSPETQALIAQFTASRWGVFEGPAADGLIAQMLRRYANDNSMQALVHRDASGRAVVDNKVRIAFVLGILAWAPKAVARLQMIEATAPQLETGAPPASHPPAGSLAPPSATAPQPATAAESAQPQSGAGQAAAGARPTAPTRPAPAGAPVADDASQSRAAPGETAAGARPAVPPQPAGGTAPASAPAGNASVLRGGGTARYVDSNGNVTAEGAAFLRSHFERAGATRDMRTAEMSDADLSHELAQNWQWLETLQLAELRRQWELSGGQVVGDLRAAAASPSFVFARASITLRQVLRYINRAAARLATGQAGSDAVLSKRTWDFLQERIAAGDQAVNELVGQIKERFPSEWKRFETTGKLAQFGDAFGTLGDKMPDTIEVDLSANRIAVIDITQAYSDPRHNLKTVLYMRALEAMFPQMTVTAREYRRPGQASDF